MPPTSLRRLKERTLFDKIRDAADNALHQKEVLMRHTILIATLSSVAASVVTTAVISGLLFGAGIASSANPPSEAAVAVSPGGL